MPRTAAYTAESSSSSSVSGTRVVAPQAGHHASSPGARNFVAIDCWHFWQSYTLKVRSLYDSRIFIGLRHYATSAPADLDPSRPRIAPTI